MALGSPPEKEACGGHGPGQPARWEMPAVGAAPGSLSAAFDPEGSANGSHGRKGASRSEDERARSMPPGSRPRFFRARAGSPAEPARSMVEGLKAGGSDMGAPRVVAGWPRPWLTRGFEVPAFGTARGIRAWFH